jgi:spore coat-associated protein N
MPTAAPTPTPSPSPTAVPALAISIDRGATAVFDLTHLVPGDSMARTITVQNSGSVAFRYTISATQTASTPLWTDGADGLQLTVRTAGGTVIYAGPLSGLGPLAGPTVLAPGTSELLRYTVDFPATASNAFQGLVQDLALVFDAIEFP